MTCLLKLPRQFRTTTSSFIKLLIPKLTTETRQDELGESSGRSVTLFIGSAMAESSETAGRRAGLMGRRDRL